MRAITAGSFAVFSSDRKNITPRGKKARALLAYLISDPGTRIPKRRIVGLLWPDRGDVQARSSLRQVLLELRNYVNQRREIVCWDREHVWIRPECLVEAPADESAGYKEAFEDLDGVSPEFDDWLASERSRRSTRRRAELKAVTEALLRESCAEEALSIVAQMQEIDPYDEDALRLGMEAEFQRRHSAGLAERYRTTAELMMAELGVEPSAATRELRNRLIARLTSGEQRQASSDNGRGYFSPRAGDGAGAAAMDETDPTGEGGAGAGVPLMSWKREAPAAAEDPTVIAPYLKRPLVIHAARWFKHGDHPAVVAQSEADPVGYVDTPEGRLRVDPGDWIITGIAGENYPCKPDVFDQLYVPASPPAHDHGQEK